ncbi:MAG: hypothetical protein ACRC67_07400 [Inquilinus sp.]|uniref:hypothetical protein n=1 Tax=Inquilinus sp. TaxID=1932117 RepID=UPI003F3C5D69
MAQSPTTSRKAAIDLDDIQEKPLGEVSAADFLSALSNSGVRGVTVMRVWPEKKKLELLLEPEFSSGLTVGRLVDRLTEKKKYELEKAFPSEIHKRVGTEGEWVDPRQFIVDPVEIAREVARQLKRG